MICKTAALFALTVFSTTAFGHPGHEHASGFMAGVAHPFMGVDHLLAMVALGLWAALWKGRSMLIAPTIFLTSMLIGALFALNGGNLPFVEHGIALSVLVMGLLVAIVPVQGVSLLIALPLIAVGAAMHGYAHGSELPAGMSTLQFIAGFATATALLHSLGILIGLQLSNRTGLRRAAGLAIAVAGSVLAAGLQ